MKREYVLYRDIFSERAAFGNEFGFRVAPLVVFRVSSLSLGLSLVVIATYEAKRASVQPLVVLRPW